MLVTYSTYTIVKKLGPQLMGLKKIECTLVEISKPSANLQELNFTDNCLTGNIPMELGRLINMKSLDLSRNQLYGSIPSGLFANCNNVNFFNVSSNNLTGSLPMLLSNCPNLRTVDFGNNSFHGEIPQEFGQLNYLEELVMALIHISEPTRPY